MPLPLTSNSWGDEEAKAAIEVIRSKNTTMGYHVMNFEREFADFFRAKYAIMCNSGSSANLLAAAAITYSKFEGKPKEPEVIVPAVSWATTFYPIVQLGYKLRFVDIDLESLNINLDRVYNSINENTAGIFAVNLLGQPAALIELQELCKKRDIFLLEDNCESMGAKINERYCGTFGEIGTFSFFYSHHINTMEGGMCLTDDEKLAQYLHSLRAHGWTRGLPDKNLVFDKFGDSWEDQFRFVLPGYNLRPLEVSAAIGRIQLSKFESMLKARKSNAAFFNNRFRDIPNILIQRGEGESSSFAFSIILKQSLQGKRPTILNLLEKNGIETRPIVTGNFIRQPVFQYLNADFVDWPNADQVHFEGFYIGNHSFDIKTELEKVAKIIESANEL